jgi:general secretion pathway protein A
MYTQTFGLKLDPFSIAPDPRFLFMSDRHREALAHLMWGVAGPGVTAGGSGGGFVLLTGDIGAGKTTICRCFLQQIPARCNVGYIFNPKLSVIELLESICEEFHVALPPDKAVFPTAKAYIDTLNTHLLDRHAAGESCVLIIDEAQNLSSEVLEQLRLLTNLETNERKLLQIVLIGQPELRGMLARPELEQLAQRVTARCHLNALNLAETRQYIAHRLAVAGLVGALPFDAPALKRIHELTRGVPRRINLLCGRALLGVWAKGEQQADRAMVERAAKEVFDIETISKTTNSHSRKRIAVGLLVLALAGAVGALAVWSTLPKTPPSASANAPAH